MKKLIIFFIFINTLIFPKIIDDNNFYHSTATNKLNDLIKTIETTKKIKINLILLNSEILLSENSFFNSVDSVYIVHTHKEGLIENTQIFTSPNISIDKSTLPKLEALVRKNLALNKRISDSQDETINSTISCNFYSSIVLKELNYSIDLINLTKEFSAKNSVTVTLFLKRNPLFLKLLLGFLFLLFIKIIMKIFLKKE